MHYQLHFAVSGQPPAPPGMSFETLAQRCAACRMLGGRIDVSFCTPKAKLEQWHTRFNQRCPHASLNPANIVAARVAMFSLAEEHQSAEGYLVDSEPNPNERRRIRERVSYARAAKRVRDAHDQMMKDLRMKAAAEEKARGRA